MTTLHFETVAPHHVTVESRAKPWTIPEMSVFAGYDPQPDGGIKAVYETLTEADLLRDWLEEISTRMWLKHHTYQVFARYRVHGSRHIYDGLLVRDANELTARSGQIEKVVEVAL